MARQASRSTDFGTIVLHWLLVVALIIAVATGLRIASYAPDLAWLRIFDAILPRATTWSGHIFSGSLLFAVAVAYVAYISQAGLWRRIRFDKARLTGLVFGRSQARLGALNILLYWVLFAVLSVLLTTGCLLYLGYGGKVVTLHRCGTWIVLAFPVAHMAVHWAIGGAGQLLRVLRPARLAPPPPPFDPFEVLALPDYSSQAPIVRGQANNARRPSARPRPASSVVDEWRRSDTILHANPLAVATAAGLVALMILMAADEISRDSLVLRRIAPADAPTLDGDVADAVWRSAPVLRVPTQQGLNFDGTGATNVEIRAVHDGKTAYFSFIWEDPTRSLKHVPLLKKEDGWYVVQTNYGIEDENAYHDDAFAVALTTSERSNIGYSGGHSFHIGPQPLADKPPSFSGRGLHYTRDSNINDVWYWKASRGGMLGWCDDAYIGLPVEPTRDQVEGRRRYLGGLAYNSGTGMHEPNFDKRPPGGYDRPVQPRRLPKQPRRTWEAMGRITLDPNLGESEGAIWWLTEANSVPYSPELDELFPVGSLIPGVLITGEPTGERAHLRCAAKWAAGRWTLELARRLDTGSDSDIPITSRSLIRLAAFDHSQIGHTRQIRLIRLEVE